MKFDIDGRFQVEVRRERDGWTLYRLEQGKRGPLDDVFHEYAGPGPEVRRMPD